MGQRTGDRLIKIRNELACEYRRSQLGTWLQFVVSPYADRWHTGDPILHAM